MVVIDGYYKTLAANKITFLGDPVNVAILYTISLMGILGIHELGHMIASKWHKLRTSWPYFIRTFQSGIYMGISETVQRAVVTRYVPSELLVTAFGLFSLVLGVSFFVSNVIFGFLWDHYSLVLAITYSIGLTSIAIVSMIVFLKKYSLY